MKRGVLFLLCLVAASAAARASGFSGWAAVVVAGDSYAEDGKSSAVFDNGRMTMAKELVGLGFAPENIRQFTDWPERFRGPGIGRSTPRLIAAGLRDAARHAPDGCFLYLTSHGSEKGIGIGDYVLGPRTLKHMIDTACRSRPAVIVVSACYSGVFVPYLKAVDRIVLTAAAADRSSFGCGETDKYTYFDTCAVEALPGAGDFETFGQRAIACVRAREAKEKVDLPSNPQLAVGSTAVALIPHWKPR